MPTLLEIQQLTMLEEALASDFGAVIAVHPRGDFVAPARRARQALYAFRKSHAPTFDCIQIRLAPDDPDHTLWLIRRSTPTPEPDLSC